MFVWYFVDVKSPVVSFLSILISACLSLLQTSRLACDNSVSAADSEQLRSLCSKDPLYELSEQDKDFLWRHR